MIQFLDAQTDELVGYVDDAEGRNYTADEIEEDVFGLKRFNFTLPANIPEAVGIENRQRILVPHKTRAFQEFICYNAVNGRKTKRVIAIGSEVEINKTRTVPPGRHESKMLRYYLDLATDGIEWEVGDVAGGLPQTLEFDEHIGGFDFLKRLATAFNVEFIFRVEVDHNRVTGRFIDAVEKIGKKTGKEFVNTKDLIDLQKEIFTDRICTALWLILPNDADGNARPPLFISDDAAFQRWNRKGQHLVDIHVIDSSDTEMTNEKALQYGRTELNKRIASVVEYTIEALDLGPLYPHETSELGDYVRLVDEEFNPPLYAEARIISIKRPVQRPNMDKPVKKIYTIGETVEYSKKDMDAAMAEMRKKFEAIVANAERLALEAQATANGVVDSERLQQLLDQKANADQLGDFVTGDQLQTVNEEVAAKIQEAMKNIDLSGLATTDEVAKETEKLEEDIKKANSYNKLKNSIGYSDLDFWLPVYETPQVIRSVMNESLERLGFGAGFFFPASADPKGFMQVVNVTPYEPMTLSWYFEKSKAGAFTIEILEEEVVRLTVPDFSDPIYPYRSSWVPYTPETGQVGIRVTAAAATEGTLTGLMLAEGSLPGAWTLAHGELYNAYVRVGEKGLGVYQLDENGDIEGYTNVSPQEFAIYFDENKNGDMDRVFWFSRDEMVAKKGRFLEEISMGTLKMVYTDTPTNRGWTMVSRINDPN